MDLRAINRLIQGPDFDSIWESGTNVQRSRLLQAIKAIDHDAVRYVLSEMQRLDLRDLTKRELLVLARRYRIRNYSRKPKSQLVNELLKRGVDDKAI